MDRIGEHQGRLQLPKPYILIVGIPALSPVQARLHGWELQTAESYAMDFGERPVLYNVPAGATPPAAAQMRMPGATVFYWTGNPPGGGLHEDEYLYPYNWQAFAPAIGGTLQPKGKREETFSMPDLPASPAARPDRTFDDLAVLRIRWQGANAVALANAIAGAASPGPYTINLAGMLGGGVPIVPGTVRIVAPDGGGGFWTVRDLPWPSAVEARQCVTGRMIGDVDPNVDSTINYETGVAVITFPGNVPVPPPQIQAEYEWGYDKQPIDYRVNFDVNAI
jgi:hypothetical protein